MATTKAQAKKAIKELDEELELLREGWLGTDDKIKKAKFWRMINTMLDDRLEHMAIRDGKKKND
jgi:hypothetical protein